LAQAGSSQVTSQRIRPGGMRVSVSLGFWYFLLFIIVYRQVLKSTHVQKVIHSLGVHWLPAMLQWYNMYLCGVLFYMSYSIYELLTEYDSLSEADVTDNLTKIYHLPQNYGHMKDDTLQAFIARNQVRPWLRYTNLASQLTGIPVVFITVFHVWKLLILPGKRLADEHVDWRQIPWKPPTRMNWLLLVITMPSMFSVMSMRATCRILAVMTGKATGHTEHYWPRVQTIEFAMYTSDLELAALFQFSSVYAFARICGSILSEAIFSKGPGATQDLEQVDARKLVKEYAFALKAAGFLGVWAFVAIGMLRCLFSFVIAEAEQFETYAGIASSLQSDALQSVSTVFSALTILCVINMIIICQISVIKDKLGDANMKFTGTRVLLLAGEVQARVISAFTVGSTLYEKAEQFSSELHKKVQIYIHEWSFSDEQAHLFHLSVLNFECLLVVIFNLITWYWLDLERSGIMNFKHFTKPDNNHPEKEALLDAEDVDF